MRYQTRIGFRGAAAELSETLIEVANQLRSRQW
jgi:hypothetical protein